MDEIIFVIPILPQQACLSVPATPEFFIQGIFTLLILSHIQLEMKRIIFSAVLYINTPIHEFISKIINLYCIDHILFFNTWPEHTVLLLVQDLKTILINSFKPLCCQKEDIIPPVPTMLEGCLISDFSFIKRKLLTSAAF